MPMGIIMISHRTLSTGTPPKKKLFFNRKLSIDDLFIEITRTSETHKFLAYAVFACFQLCYVFAARLFANKSQTAWSHIFRRQRNAPIILHIVIRGLTTVGIAAAAYKCKYKY